MSVKRTIRVPKYVRLAEMFRQQVKDGLLKPGDRLPSFLEMRQQHGIGQGTLERVHALLENDGLITREPGRGTFIAEPAGAPQSGVIGFCAGGLADVQSFAYWMRLMSSVFTAARGANKQILLLDPDSPSGWDKVDGVLMSVWKPQEVLRWLPERASCVSVIVPVAELTSVVADDFGGVKAATGHLIRQGHRRIAYLSSTDNTLSLKRTAGYKEALRDAGIAADPRWLRAMAQPIEYNERLVSYGRSAMKEWLRGDWRELGCTAIIAHSDDAACGIMEALQEAGIGVPDQVSIVGFDDIDVCEFVRPRLTSVAVPLRDIGAAAFDLLLQHIDGKRTAAETIIMPTHLQERDSTRRLN